jgi:hypothetical protein
MKAPPFLEFFFFFPLLSSDGNGSISKDKFATVLALFEKVLSEEDQAKVWRILDSDGSGSISFIEFLTGKAPHTHIFLFLVFFFLLLELMLEFQKKRASQSSAYYGKAAGTEGAKANLLQTRRREKVQVGGAGSDRSSVQEIRQRWEWKYFFG